MMAQLLTVTSITWQKLRNQKHNETWPTSWVEKIIQHSNGKISCVQQRLIRKPSLDSCMRYPKTINGFIYGKTPSESKNHERRALGQHILGHWQLSPVLNSEIALGENCSQYCKLYFHLPRIQKRDGRSSYPSRGGFVLIFSHLCARVRNRIVC